MSNIAKPIGSLDLSKYTLIKNDLFPVYESRHGEKIVNLRDVHAALKVRKKFADWAEEKMAEHGMSTIGDKPDFVKKHLEGKIKKRGRLAVEYILPLKNAKKVAMGVNTPDADFVKDYFLLCEELAIRAMMPLPEPIRFIDFTNEPVQKACAKNVAGHLMGTRTNPKPAIEHFRETCTLLTGFQPSQYRRNFLAQGFRVASFSGRGLLRKFEPAKACTAAFLDDARLRGKSLPQLAAAGVIEALPQAFSALLKAGYSLAELEAMAA